MSDRLVLLASSDDYLLADAVAAAVAGACRELGVDDAEVLPDEVTPEAVAVELENLSLFSPRRVLVVRNGAGLLGSGGGRRRGAAADPSPALATALAAGAPDGMALVLGAHCDAKPSGPVVETFARHGRVVWIPLPAPPKPWEEAVLSQEQLTVLRSVLRRAVPEARFAPAAETLLLDRLGFAPRLLVEEARKLATAAGPGGTVVPELVLRLTLPQDRSLDGVYAAVERRDPGAVLQLLGEGAAGVPVTDRKGERLDRDGLASAVVGTAASLLEKLLEVRLVARELGLEAELDPVRAAADGWYPRHFKARLAPPLEARLAEAGAASPLNAGRPTGTWSLGQLFTAASLYREEELVAALTTAGAAEVGARGELPLEAVSRWLATLRPAVALSPAHRPRAAGGSRR